MQIENFQAVLLPGDLLPEGRGTAQMAATADQPWSDCRVQLRVRDRRARRTEPQPQTAATQVAYRRTLFPRLSDGAGKTLIHSSPSSQAESGPMEEDDSPPGFDTSNICTSLKCGLVRPAAGYPHSYETVNFQNRYIPRAGDIVIGTITQRTSDFFLIDIRSPVEGFMSHVSFSMATKRNRPKPDVGGHLLCCIANSPLSACGEVELSCISADETKSWSTGETYLGELKGGFVIEVPVHQARAMMGERALVLDLLGKELKFETAIGANGRMWIKSAKPWHTVIVANAVRASFGLESTFVEALVTKFLERKDDF
eukprot:Selendium_serpulae@DN4368_c0_g1_i4.p1